MWIFITKYGNYWTFAAIDDAFGVDRVAWVGAVGCALVGRGSCGAVPLLLRVGWRAAGRGVLGSWRHAAAVAGGHRIAHGGCPVGVAVPHYALPMSRPRIGSGPSVRPRSRATFPWRRFLALPQLAPTGKDAGGFVFLTPAGFTVRRTDKATPERIATEAAWRCEHPIPPRMDEIRPFSDTPADRPRDHTPTVFGPKGIRARPGRTSATGLPPARRAVPRPANLTHRPNSASFASSASAQGFCGWGRRWSPPVGLADALGWPVVKRRTREPR